LLIITAHTQQSRFTFHVLSVLAAAIALICCARLAHQ